MIVTSSGRPLGHVPLFRLADGKGRYALLLSRIDVSDVGNEPKAEGFYTPLVSVQSEDQMTTVEVRLGKAVAVIFISPKRITWHVAKPDQETES
jgi:hypothetical protein